MHTHIIRTCLYFRNRFEEFSEGQWLGLSCSHCYGCEFDPCFHGKTPTSCTEWPKIKKERKKKWNGFSYYY